MDNQNNWFRNPQDDLQDTGELQNNGFAQTGQEKFDVNNCNIPSQNQNTGGYTIPQQNFDVNRIESKTKEKDPKKNTTIIIAALCAVVVALAVAVIVLLSGGDEKKGNVNFPGGGETGETVEYNVGDYITFGRYDLDGKKQNGTEAIDWLVLDKQEGQLLVISKDILFTNRFTNERNSGDQWDNSEIRKIMNIDFYDEAFNEDEKGMIYTTNVLPGKNPYYGIDAGMPTEDKLFLLSVDEVTKYLSSENARKCFLSGLAKQTVGGFPSHWCTRTPGQHQGTVVVLHCADGVIEYDGFYKANPFGVRPAMWLDSELLKDYAPNPGQQGGNEGENGGEGGEGGEGGKGGETPPPEAIMVCEVGDIITYGRYEQDNNESNGRENIEWIVLDVKDGKALVLSLCGLEWQQYNTTDEEVTWETCTLRQWLNNEFLDSSFVEGEKEMICTTTVSPVGNRDDSTEDKVFLLSEREANKYEDYYIKCEGTEYTDANSKATVVDDPTIDMSRVLDYDSAWCRSGAGNTATEIATLTIGWDVSVDGYSLVRPAMWIELSE